MGVPWLLIIAAGCCGLAVLLAWREWGLYRGRPRQRDETDLFVYTRRRLFYRLAGLAAVTAIGATIAAWEMRPPRSPGAASVYLALFAIELTALVLFPILDLRETRRTAAEYELPRR